MDSMDSSPTTSANWHAEMPMGETFEDAKRRLSAELQLATARLVIHLKTSSFRIRMAGTDPEIYITIGSGRYNDSAAGDINRGLSTFGEPAGSLPEKMPGDAKSIEDLIAAAPEEELFKILLSPTQDEF
jgi:hypothetical protein